MSQGLAADAATILSLVGLAAGQASTACMCERHIVKCMRRCRHRGAPAPECVYPSEHNLHPIHSSVTRVWVKHICGKQFWAVHFSQHITAL